MDAKKCDRCGKIFGDMEKSEMLNKMLDFTPRTMAFRGKEHPSGMKAEGYWIAECCPECMEEIYLFVTKSHK